MKKSLIEISKASAQAQIDNANAGDSYQQLMDSEANAWFITKLLPAGPKELGKIHGAKMSWTDNCNIHGSKPKSQDLLDKMADSEEHMALLNMNAKEQLDYAEETLGDGADLAYQQHMAFFAQEDMYPPEMLEFDINDPPLLADPAAFISLCAAFAQQKA